MYFLFIQSLLQSTFIVWISFPLPYVWFLKIKNKKIPCYFIVSLIFYMFRESMIVARIRFLRNRSIGHGVHWGLEYMPGTINTMIKSNKKKQFLQWSETDQSLLLLIVDSIGASIEWLICPSIIYLINLNFKCVFGIFIVYLQSCNCFMKIYKPLLTRYIIL